MNAICERCYFWVRFENQPRPNSILGECRRRAPRIFQRHDGSAGDGKLMTKWPTPHHDDWCGEFRVAEPPAASGDEAR